MWWRKRMILYFTGNNVLGFYVVKVLELKKIPEASNIKRNLTRKGDCSRNASGEQETGWNSSKEILNIKCDKVPGQVPILPLTIIANKKMLREKQFPVH